MLEEARCGLFHEIEHVLESGAAAVVGIGDFSPLEVHVTTTFDEAKGKTALKQRIVYATKQERDADYDGVATSSAEAFASLDRYLESAGKR